MPECRKYKDLIFFVLYNLARKCQKTSFGQFLLGKTMILSNIEIQEEIDSGELCISPFDADMLQPASYDLKVGEDAATVPDDGSPTINLKDEGFMIIGPYCPAVVWAMEEIRFPLNIAGRFGLKSGLSRRGVYASVGPQIDPGFDGKLYVTLFNLTPSPVALNYGDSFLTMELHRLARPPLKGYDGSYQHRKKFTSREIEPVLGYKGSHGLGEVVKGFHELKKAIDTIASLSSRFDNFLEDYAKQNREVSEYNRALMNEMRVLVGHIVGDRPKTIVLRAITKDEARREILDLFRSKGSETLFYSDISEQLQLDLEMVVELCHELEQEGKIGLFGQHEAK
jgi:dCTP deaminase